MQTLQWPPNCKGISIFFTVPIKTNPNRPTNQPTSILGPEKKHNKTPKKYREFGDKDKAMTLRELHLFSLRFTLRFAKKLKLTEIEFESLKLLSRGDGGWR